MMQDEKSKRYTHTFQIVEFEFNSYNKEELLQMMREEMEKLPKEEPIIMNGQFFALAKIGLRTEYIRSETSRFKQLVYRFKSICYYIFQK